MKDVMLEVVNRAIEKICGVTKRRRIGVRACRSCGSAWIVGGIEKEVGDSLYFEGRRACFWE